MAVYAITGKLGSGKGKAGMMKLREYLRAGKRVATNCDVFMEYIDHERAKSTVTRIPDKPTATDLYMVGSGNRYVEFTPNITVTVGGDIVGAAPLLSPRMLPGFDESHNGALVLDECGSWLNTRNFQDKGRAEMLEWCIHARKYGWDIFFIMQNANQIDKQIRESLFEYVVRLNRLDRMRVPLISGAVKAVTAGALTGNMPRVHIAVVRMDASPDGLVADRWIFQGDDLHDVYNTTQVFSENYPHGVHTLLSPWHLSAKPIIEKDFVGPCRAIDVKVTSRKQPLKPPHPHMTKFLFLALFLGGALGCFGTWYLTPKQAAVSAVAVTEKVSDTISGKGYMDVGGKISVVLSDGQIIQNPPKFKSDADGNWTAQIRPDLLVRGGTK